jgi:DNA polymerase III epsilon subunit-like protein
MPLNYKTLSPNLGLCLDWETSGSDFDSSDNTQKYQGLSYGAIIFDTRTFEPVDKLYVEMKFDESKYKWSMGAQNIHGLSREYLEQFGISREEGCILLAEFILKYLGPNANVMFAGHNANYDIGFTKQLFRDFGLEFNTYHVVLDTAPMCFTAFGTHKSNDLFEIFGFDTRNAHNALQDAEMTLECLKNFRALFNEIFD